MNEGGGFGSRASCGGAYRFESRAPARAFHKSPRGWEE